MDCHLAYCYGNRRRCDYNMSRCIQSFPRVTYNSTRSLILLYMALCTLLLLKASAELFLNDDSLKMPKSIEFFVDAVVAHAVQLCFVSIGNIGYYFHL